VEILVSDFIDHHLPEDSVSAHGASHHAWATGPPPSKSGAGFRFAISLLMWFEKMSLISFLKTSLE